MSPADLAVENHEIFVHVRIIIGMILGIGIARLVTGATRFIQHPGKHRIYSVHLGWIVFLFLSIIHFWWSEFALTRIERWTFPLYVLLICYAATRQYGRAFWKRWTGYHARSRAEVRMRCLKAFGGRIAP